MKPWTTSALDAATVTGTRPQGFDGSPLALFSSSSVHDAPPSVLLNRPLPLGASGPSPPERNVHPLRRKSHITANSVFGFCGSIDILEHHVDALGPFRTLVHFLPPSVVLRTPRSTESL